MEVKVSQKLATIKQRAIYLFSLRKVGLDEYEQFRAELLTVDKMQDFTKETIGFINKVNNLMKKV
jgi:hypothetical protein